MSATRMVVVGGDAAGMTAASQARRRRGPEDLDVVVFERGPRTSYSACGLPYLVEGVVGPPDRLVARTPEQFAARDITVHVHHEVTAVDTVAATVRVRDLSTGRERAEAYDELVVATGAVGIRPPLPGIDSEGITQLRTIDDAVALDRRIAEGARRAVVVGAGYIGLEVAEALVARGLRVTVVELAESPMSTALDPDMAALVTDAMVADGVELRLGEGVEGFEQDRGVLRAVSTASGAVETDLAVLALGVRPATDLAGPAGLALGGAGGFVVDDRMHTPTEGVWAAGDCVESLDRLTGTRVVMALGTHANKQGRVLGTNLAGGRATFPGVIGTAVTRFGELEIGRSGLTAARAAEFGIELATSTSSSRTRAGYYPGSAPVTVKLLARPSDGVLVGAQVIGGTGAAKRIDALAVAIWTGMTAEELAYADLSYAPPFSPVWDPVVDAAAHMVRTLEVGR